MPATEEVPLLAASAEPETRQLVPDEPAPDLALDAEFQSPERFPGAKVLAWAAAVGAVAIAAVLLWRYESREPPPAFQFAILERGRIDATVSATGTCNAVVDVVVGSQVSGNIKALYADFNTRVKAGQLVALIDPEIFQAQVDQADAAWRNSKAARENALAAAAKADADLYSARAAEVNQTAAIAKAKVGVADANTKLARRKTMFDEAILSKEDLDTAQATYDEAVADQEVAEAQHDAAVHNVQSAQAALDASNKQVAMIDAQIELNLAALNQARINLDHTRIVAPVDGTVIARRMDVGQTVAASFQTPTIFEIAQDLTKMQVDTNVAESDVGRLEVGQTATFSVDAYPGLVFQGKLVQIREAPINVQNVITYDAVIQVPNPDLKLFPGMTANVTILTRRVEGALKVPNAALRVKLADTLLEKAAPSPQPPGGNWATVYVADKTAKARPVPLKLGITDGNFTEAQSSQLQEGQPVIVGSGVHGPAPPPSQSMPGAGRF